MASLGLAGTANAALQGSETSAAPLVLIGRDDDTTTDTTIQPAGVAADQTLRKGDQLRGGRRTDVLIGRLGPDTLTAGDGDDVLAAAPSAAATSRPSRRSTSPTAATQSPRASSPSTGSSAATGAA